MSDHTPTHTSRTWRHRALGAGLVIATVVALTGCSNGLDRRETIPEGATLPALSPTAEPGDLTTEQVIDDSVGTYADAEAVLTVDGDRVAAGTSKCARAIDESTDGPAIRLLVQGVGGRDSAEVVVADSDSPTVISAVVLQGDAKALTGAEGLDGSTLEVTRTSSDFHVTGSVQDQSVGTTHELEMRTTCQGL